MSIWHGLGVGQWESEVRAQQPVLYLGKSNWVSFWPPCPTNFSVKLDFHSGKGATNELIFPRAQEGVGRGGGVWAKNKIIKRISGLIPLLPHLPDCHCHQVVQVPAGHLYSMSPAPAGSRRLCAPQHWLAQLETAVQSADAARHKPGTDLCKHKQNYSHP